MIMVLYGVGESRELIKSLKESGYRVAAVARTEYGCQAAGSSGADRVVPAPSGYGDMSELIRTLGVKQVVDATHPFANPLSAAARDVCSDLEIPYIRFGRAETVLPQDPLICRVQSWEKAAETASGFSGTVFLTTGSYNLEVFTRYRGLRGRRVVVRVLPDHRVVKKCQELGISPRDIVAMQGPFSVKLNKAIFQAYRAGVVVTRDGGPSGGAYNKVKAALDLKIPVVLIQRDDPPGAGCLDDIGLLLETVAGNDTAGES
ncbi:MAG: precorrin-6A reductase [Peptococcaceae bacterium]|nr:precorrin-6A reductase [Peptococcaceae bacterium]